jgi:hypothetical protein
MRQIDNMTDNELEVLTLKGMLTTNKPTTQNKNNMPTTVTLRKRVKDADKKHSVIFSTESATEMEREIVDTIYFKRPFIDNVKEITITVVRDTDHILENL